MPTRKESFIGISNLQISWSTNLEGKFQDQPVVEADIRWQLGMAYYVLGHYKASIPHLARSYQLRRELFGEKRSPTSYTKNYLALAYLKAGQFSEAEGLFDELIEARQQGPNTLGTKNDLAVLYKEQGDYDKVEPLLLEAVEGHRIKIGDTHPHILESMKNLITLYKAWNKPEKAKEWRVELPQAENTRK